MSSHVQENLKLDVFPEISRTAHTMVNDPDPEHNPHINEKKTDDIEKKSSQILINLDQKVSRLLASAPSTPKLHTITPEVQQTIEKCTARRSKSCLDGSKVRCTITSERLAQLRKTVENAMKEHRIFSIKGNIISNDASKV